MFKKVLLPLVLVSIPIALYGLATAQPPDTDELKVDDAGSGRLRVAMTVPVNERRLEQLRVRSVRSAEVKEMLSKLAFLDEVSRRGSASRAPNYTCDSKTNKCTCDANDPLDCIEIYEECSGPLGPVGSPSRLCLPGSPGSTCECRWHLQR